ncbi:hypothetical protein [Sulfitobacter alexandrii]|nr:hypothetical protein [Sulfitobacter alexandrii]
MTLVALAASGLAGQMLHETLNTLPDEIAGQAEVRTAATEPQPPAPPPSPRRWPAVFGELQPPAPPPPAAEPQPPAPTPEPQPPRPPLDSLGYALKGVVRVDQKIWAMVSHPTGETLLRVGDTLGNGAVIERIDEQGVWVDNGDGDLALLGFTEEKRPPG